MISSPDPYGLYFLLEHITCLNVFFSILYLTLSLEKSIEALLYITTQISHAQNSAILTCTFETDVITTSWNFGLNVIV